MCSFVLVIAKNKDCFTLCIGGGVKESQSSIKSLNIQCHAKGGCFTLSQNETHICSLVQLTLTWKQVLLIQWDLFPSNRAGVMGWHHQISAIPAAAPVLTTIPGFPSGPEEVCQEAKGEGRRNSGWYCMLPFSAFSLWAEKQKKIQEWLKSGDEGAILDI